MSADEFALAQPADAIDTLAPVKIKMLARSSNAVRVFRDVKLAHDMSGMVARGKVPIDLEHETPVGFADGFSLTDRGLEVSGWLVPTDVPGDPARRIITLARAGMPWEASIEWRPVGDVEKIEAGESATVNGQQVEGPAIVARKWRLRAIAVAKLGADDATRT